MDDVAIFRHWILEQHLPPLWVVVLAAVVLAWLDHAAKSHRMQPYDAWWFFNVRRSDLTSVRGPRHLPIKRAVPK